MEKYVHGGDIYSNRCKIDFSASVSPLALPESVREAACRAFDRCSAYPDPECRELRRALACKEGVPEEQIVCGNGASDLIYAVTRAVHPRKALLYTPSFSEYETALSLEESEISWYTCRSGNEFTLDEGFIEAITEDIDMVFVCNPGNPTGTAVPTQILKKIAERCAAAGCVLVSDECFVPLMEERTEEKVSLKSFLSRMPELFIIRSLTKVFPLAGMRIGYGLCSDSRLLQAVRAQMQPWNVSLPAQETGTAIVQEPEFEAKTWRLLREEKKYLFDAMRELGLKCLTPSANYIFFYGPEDLYEQCRARGILIRDCSGYRGLFPGCYRVAVRTHEDNEELIRVLTEIREDGQKNHT